MREGIKCPLITDNNQLTILVHNFLVVRFLLGGVAESLVLEAILDLEVFAVLCGVAHPDATTSNIDIRGHATKNMQANGTERKEKAKKQNHKIIIGERTDALVLALTVGTETGVLEDGLLRLLDAQRLETSVVHQGAAARWISILQRQSAPVRFRLVMKSSGDLRNFPFPVCQDMASG